MELDQFRKLVLVPSLGYTMPSFDNIFLVASPRDSNSDEEQMSDLAAKLSPGTQLPGTSTTVPGSKHHSAASATGEARTLPALGSVKTPDFKTGTLAGLLNVSEAVAKHDTAFTGILSKIVDTIRSLDPNELKRERSDLHLVLELEVLMCPQVTWSWMMADHSSRMC